MIICDKITDVRNFGAIARTAYGAGAHAIVIPQTETASITSESVKASAGALMNIPVCREKKLSQLLKQLRLNGISVFATDAQASKMIYEVDLKNPCAIILGSEGAGITVDLIRNADELVKVPMVNALNSYNVSVAAGMVLYEAMKQRGA